MVSDRHEPSRRLSPTAQFEPLESRALFYAGPSVYVEHHPEVSDDRVESFITIRYTDVDGVDVSTLGDDDLRYAGWDGDVLPYHLVRTSAGPDPGSVVATYELGTRGDAWDANDNGWYDVDLRSGAVKDTLGNAAPGFGALGNFLVDLDLDAGGDPDKPAPDPVVRMETPGTNGRKLKVFHPGDTINANVIVDNDGSGVLRDSDVVIDLMRSSGGPVRLASGSKRFDLEPDGRTRFPVKLQLPDDATRGNYILRVALSVNGPQEGRVNDNVEIAGSFAILEGGGGLYTSGPDDEQDNAPHVRLIPGRRQSVTFVKAAFEDQLPIDSDFTLTVKADPVGAVLDAEPIVLQTSTRRLKFKPGQRKSISVRFAVPETLPAGTYRMILTTDAIILPPVPTGPPVVIS